MDGPNDISVNSVKDQSAEVIQTVANRLAIIGDELTLSYQDLSCSSLEKLKSCATLEGSLDILLSVLKALSWNTNNTKPKLEIHGRTWQLAWNDLTDERM